MFKRFLPQYITTYRDLIFGLFLGLWILGGLLLIATAYFFKPELKPWANNYSLLMTFVFAVGLVLPKVLIPQFNKWLDTPLKY